MIIAIRKSNQNAQKKTRLILTVGNEDYFLAEKVFELGLEGKETS